MYDIIIIGLGPAGINASIYAKRTNANILVIEKGTPGGALNSIKDIHNYLGYEHVSGSDLAFDFYKQFKSLNVPLVNEEVENVVFSENIFEVVTDKNTYTSKAVIVATGRGEKKLGIPNENLEGVSHCVLCDANLYQDKVICLYGNNPKTILDAVYLSNIVNKLYLIVPEYIDTTKVNNIDNIELIINDSLDSINGTNKIESITVGDMVINIDGLFINNGYGPITSFVKDLGITDDKGYILIDTNGMTSVPGLFACGDNIKKDVYQIITSASEGAIAGINASKYVQK